MYSARYAAFFFYVCVFHQTCALMYDVHPGKAKQADADPLSNHSVSANTAPVQQLQENVGGNGKMQGGPAAGAEGGAHHSIFELTVADLDSQTFWYVMILMICFTIIIDRTQALGDGMAERSAGNKLLWQRVNSELMMFGVVAISIFMVTNFFASIPEHQYLLVEFVDILCSCGCCGLILVVSLLLLTVRFQSMQYRDFEDDSDAHPMVGPHVPTANLSTKRLGRHEYVAMVRLWKIKHKVPRNFHYDEYLQMSLVRNCCNLMCISWQTWAVSLIGSIVALYRRKARQSPTDTDSYLLEMMITNWGMVLCHFLLMLHVKRAEFEFLGELKKAVESQSDTVADPFGHNWSYFTRFIAQNLAFFNSFLVAVFFMHELYNLEGHAWWWYALLIVPLVFNFLFALPFIVSHTAAVEAFYVMDPEGMEDILEEIQADMNDIRFIRERWQAMGCPEPDSGSNLSEEDLKHYFVDLGIHISEKRSKRIHRILDGDASGYVSAKELFSVLKDDSLFDARTRDVSTRSSPRATPRLTPR